MFGILNIHKPAGWTSRDAVNRVQRFVRPYKVGHAGTLDPLATGVLVVCVGRATRLIDYVQQAEKEYVATFLLGRTSVSDDIDSEVTEVANCELPTLARIEAALPSFLGTIDQVPPAFSAVKIAGRRAYSLARQGQSVTISARQVQVYQLQILSYEYPRLQLMIRCGSGTYVRSLGRDLAETVGTKAVMSELVRERIGDFCLADAISVENLSLEQIQASIKPPAVAVSHLPKLILTTEQRSELCFGRPILADMAAECAAFDDCGNLTAILRLGPPGLLKPHINFALPVGPLRSNENFSLLGQEGLRGTDREGQFS